MSSLHFLIFVFLVSIALLVRAKGVNETHSKGEECPDIYCAAHMDGDNDTAEEYLDRLCESACEEELGTALRVAHLNYEHVRAAFGTSILIMVVIFAKLCKYIIQTHNQNTWITFLHFYSIVL